MIQITVVAVPNLQHPSLPLPKVLILHLVYLFFRLGPDILIIISSKFVTVLEGGERFIWMSFQFADQHRHYYPDTTFLGQSFLLDSFSTLIPMNYFHNQFSMRDRVTEIPCRYSIYFQTKVYIMRNLIFPKDRSRMIF